MKTQQLFFYINKEVFGKEALEKANQIDINANGVQIEGSEEVEKVALGVSCSYEFLAQAKNWGAQVCIFHHGLGLCEKYGYVLNSRIIPSSQKQLRIAFENEMTIAGYHYLLDSDKKIGNNALIIEKLGMKNTLESYFEDWGFVGEFENSIDIDELAKKCGELFRHDVSIIYGGKREIKRVGVVSGGALATGKAIFEAKEKNIDLHLSGEMIESVPAIARDSHINVFSCGHYATEVLGIKALGEKINEKFEDLEVRFIEVWNEI